LTSPSHLHFKINKIPYYPHDDGFNEWVIKLVQILRAYIWQFQEKNSLKYGGFGAKFFTKILCMSHIEFCFPCINSLDWSPLFHMHSIEVSPLSMHL
jgi:hypothetical protein